MDTTFHTLPSATSLSASILTFLDDKLRRRDQLERASDLSSELETRCGDLDRSLLDLNHRLQDGLVAYTSYSDRIGSLFGHINSGLTDLRLSSRISGLPSDGREGLERSEKVLGEELPSLAKKVARVETVRKYAGSAYFLGGGGGVRNGAQHGKRSLLSNPFMLQFLMTRRLAYLERSFGELKCRPEVALFFVCFDCRRKLYPHIWLRKRRHILVDCHFMHKNCREAVDQLLLNCPVLDLLLY